MARTPQRRPVSSARVGASGAAGSSVAASLPSCACTSHLVRVRVRVKTLSLTLTLTLTLT